MIGLIFGCAGSGKTATIVNKIEESVNAKKRTYMLVPEQQVFTAESMLAFLPPESGLYFEVISFSRLCDMVFDKFGGKNYTSVSSGLRHLIMWKSIKDVAPALSEYDKIKSDAKFSEMMLHTIDELRANSITADTLDEVSESMAESDLGMKLADISLISATYQSNLKATLGDGAVASEDKLEKLRDSLLCHDFFGGANVFVDSFTDFTGVEHDILSIIMRQAENMYISVYSKERGYHAPHTTSSSDTIKRLTRAARESNKEFGDIILNGNTRTHSLQLKLLEANLWNFSAKNDTLPEIPEEQSRDIEMVSCLNEYEETECAALKILEAHKSGTKYSEMAFILRNPEERSGIISAVFSKYSIPYFLSEKTELLTTPLARFILSSLRCIARNYATSDVLTLLKTGLCRIDDIDADLFEEYCLTWKIQGKMFREPVWSMNPNGYTASTDERSKAILASANKVRTSIITPLESLKIKLSACNGNTVEMCRALYSYMEQYELSDTLSSLAKIELELKNIKEAGEILRVYDCIITMLSSICTIIPEEILTLDEFITVIEIMLAHNDIASVPSIGEYVTVGSAATLRVENIKLAIVGEMCEGVFPALPKQNGLISETDKEKLEESGLTFKTRKDRLMSDELFYVYRAFSKPSEKLIVMTHSSNISGGSTPPSTPWRRLQTLFKLPIEEFDSKYIKSLADEQIQNAKKSWTESYVSELFGEDIRLEERISPAVVHSLFGDSIYLTKSQIQNFVKCPMLFWSQNILSLRETQAAAVGASQSGTLIHFVLENLFREVKNQDGTLPLLSDKEILELTNKWSNNYIDMISCERTPGLMFAFSKLRNAAYLLSKDICKEFAQSSFKMYSFEQKIKAHGDNALKPLEITVDDIPNSPKIYLGGTVDRIDTYEHDGKTFIRIVDYKTSNVSFSEDKVIDGSDMQLPAYLFAITSEENKSAFGGKEMTPGSAIYVSAVDSHGDISIYRSGMILNDEEFLRATNSELDYKYISTAAESAMAKNKPLPASEFLDTEGMEHIKEVLTDTVKSTGSQIFSGIIKRCPSSDSCKFCPVKSTCPVAINSKF